MIQNRRFLYIGIFILFATLWNACTEEYMPTPLEEGEKIKVSLSWNVIPITNQAEESNTKATQDFDLAHKAKITDIWVMQYDGTTDDALLAGSAHYYSGTDIIQDTDGSYHAIITLLKKDTPQTLVVIGNLHQESMEWDLATLGLMKKAYSLITTDMEGSYNEAQKDIVVSGSQKIPNLGSADRLDVSLKYNVSHIQFTLKNSAASGMKLHNVTLCQVAQENFYWHTQDATPKNFIDYDTDVVNEEQVLTEEGQTFYWMVPCNNVEQKPTYIRVIATDEEGMAYFYKIYPQKENVREILPGINYDIKLSVQTKGDPDVDRRVEKYGEVILKNANSFIVHPYPAEGIADGVTSNRIFSFPTTQINRYWGEAQGLSKESEWRAEVLWQDHEATDFITILTPKGVGYNQHIRFAVKNGVYGNAVIALKKDNSILWSWHIWSTDYDPTYTQAPTANQFVYPVSGGHVHRYGGAHWINQHQGFYFDKYIMDRNLGALNIYDRGPVYQFGRKDPFKETNRHANGVETKTPQISTKISMQESIHSPETFFTGTSNDWCTEGFSNYNWNSPEMGKAVKSIFDPCPAGWKLPTTEAWADFKYASISETDKGSRTVLEETRGLQWLQNDISGLRYWPANKERQDSPIFYPAGFWDRTGISPTGKDGYTTFIWGANASDANSGTALAGGKNVAEINGNTLGHGVNRQAMSRRYGFPVRCVQE